MITSANFKAGAIGAPPLACYHVVGRALASWYFGHPINLALVYTKAQVKAGTVYVAPSADTLRGGEAL